MKRSVLAIVLTAVALAACQQPSVGDAKTTFCTSLKTLEAAVDKAAALGPTSTVEEAQATGQELEAAWTDVQEASAELTEVQIDETKAAYDEMVGAVKGISDESTLAGATATIQGAATKFKAATAVINTTVCTDLAPSE